MGRQSKIFWKMLSKTLNTKLQIGFKYFSIAKNLYFWLKHAQRMFENAFGCSEIHIPNRWYSINVCFSLYSINIIDTYNVKNANIKNLRKK